MEEIDNWVLVSTRNDEVPVVTENAPRPPDFGSDEWDRATDEEYARYYDHWINQPD